MAAYLVGALLFAGAIAVFVFQNTAVVSIRFINWISPEVSLAVVVLAAAGLGAMIAFLVDSFRYFRVAKQVKALTNDNRRLSKELKKLQQEAERRREAKQKPSAQPPQEEPESPPPSEL